MVTDTHDKPDPGTGVRERYKRPFDLAVTALAGLALAPLWLLVAIVIPVAIRMEDGGRVFHVQTRLGRHGRHFRMVKYRTMVEDAEKGTGPVLAARGDLRSTSVGRVLRRYHLDELPQIVNVIKGEMSVVGPRPERPQLAERYERTGLPYSRRLAVRPGVMGLAQFRAGYHAHPRHKLRYDRLYIRRMGPWLDVKLIAICLVTAIRGMPWGGAETETPKNRARSLV